MFLQADFVKCFVLVFFLLTNAAPLLDSRNIESLAIHDEIIDKTDVNLFDKTPIKTTDLVKKRQHRKGNSYLVKKYFKYPESDYPQLVERKYRIKIKRQNAENIETNYDYDALKDEYMSIEEEKNSFNNTSSSSQQARIPQILHEIVDVSQPKNCSYEEETNYGIQAIRCIMGDVAQYGFTKELRKYVIRLILFWLIVYAAIAIPFWLVKGWCCCCCRCKICFPDLITEEVKTYIVRNPPGVITLANGKTKKYPAQIYEINLFRELEVKAFRF